MSEAGNYEVEFYELPNGTFPAEEFVLSQDLKTRAKLYRLIQLLELKGNELREPYSKPLGDGIFELRVRQTDGATRVLYFFAVGRRVILTNGFTKKTQKTPRSAIETAKSYRRDFWNRERERHDEKF